MFRWRGFALAALAAILLLALALRLHNIGFGLPGMYDPDEPIFMILGLKLLLEQTLNPGWFGHPGTTTIYLVSLIDVVVAVSRLATGQSVNAADFARQVYADPAILFIPARVAMALLGVAAVWLTAMVGRRASGTATGFVAAGLLAINAEHVAWSQVIRTDIPASVFMLGSLIFAMRARESGSVKDYALAGLLVGFATATKWPAASVFIAIIGAAISRMDLKAGLKRVGLAGAAAVAGLFLASPYIFLDWRMVIANVSVEVQPGHVGHNGGGFFKNLAWYLQTPIAGSVGWLGLAFATAGLVLIVRRPTSARWTIVPALATFMALLCSQNVIWTRWALPVLPLICIFTAVATVELASITVRRFGLRRPQAVTTIVALLVAAPSAAGTIDEIRERSNDTRAEAARWAEAHIPAGSTVVLEHLELRFRDRPWRILFPVGEAGCIDGKKALAGGVSFSRVQKARNGSPVVDLGNIPPELVATCRGDYAILTYFDLYRAEATRYPKELANYRRLMAGGRTVALFQPERGKSGGPIVRIVALLQH
jgi:hypothetical protein